MQTKLHPALRNPFSYGAKRGDYSSHLENLAHLRSFHPFFDAFFERGRQDQSCSNVPLNIYENDKQITVKALIAGLSKENIEIFLKDQILTIKWDAKTQQDQQKSYKTLYCGIDWDKQGEKSVKINTALKEDSINASFKEGVLSVTLEKEEKKPSKKINVQ
jgi:HSP20 family molecular chaperone IbpA